MTLIDSPKKLPNLAIVGRSPETFHLIPCFDPEFEIWVSAFWAHLYPRWDKAFEIHDESYVMFQNKEYLNKLKSLGAKNLVGPSKYCGLKIPKCPFPYFKSTVAYMIWYALKSGYTNLSFYGIEFVGENERIEQRSNFEFWLGVAISHNVEVNLYSVSGILDLSSVYGRKEKQHDDNLDK